MRSVINAVVLIGGFAGCSGRRVRAEHRPARSRGIEAGDAAPRRPQSAAGRRRQAGRRARGARESQQPRARCVGGGVQPHRRPLRRAGESRSRHRAPREAAESYKHAWETYNFARWPVENSPGKKQAYAKALEAFAAYGKLIDPPLEIVRIPFEGKEIVGYLRLPPNVRPAPLVDRHQRTRYAQGRRRRGERQSDQARHRACSRSTCRAPGRRRSKSTSAPSACIRARSTTCKRAPRSMRSASSCAGRAGAATGRPSSRTPSARASAARSCTASAYTAISSPSSRRKA